MDKLYTEKQVFQAILNERLRTIKIVKELELKSNKDFSEANLGTYRIVESRAEQQLTRNIGNSIKCFTGISVTNNQTVEDIPQDQLPSLLEKL